jgi:hypothetical protein
MSLITPGIGVCRINTASGLYQIAMGKTHRNW